MAVSKVNVRFCEIGA